MKMPFSSPVSNESEQRFKLQLQAQYGCDNYSKIQFPINIDVKLGCHSCPNCNFTVVSTCQLQFKTLRKNDPFKRGGRYEECRF